jgi:hypothetical protein
MRHVEPPCAAVWTSSTTGPRPGDDASKACVDGDRIFAARECVVCRVPTEERLLGLIADMTPRQLEVAQKLAGLPSSPLLTTTTAWTTAIAAAAKRSETRTSGRPG